MRVYTCPKCGLTEKYLSSSGKICCHRCGYRFEG